MSPSPPDAVASGAGLVSGESIIAREMAGLEIDCSRGCSWCCHQLVVLTNIEDARRILLLARERMDAPRFAAFEQQLRQQAAQIAALGYEQAGQRNWPCPLLQDNECTVYEARPVACRTVFSPDREFCRVAFNRDTLAELPPEYRELGAAISEKAMLLQLQINQLRPIDGGFELRELLVALLDEAADG